MASDTDPQRKAARRARPSHHVASTVRRVLDGESSWRRFIQSRDRGRSREPMNGQELTPRRFHSVVSAWATFSLSAAEHRAPALASTTNRGHIRHHIAHHMRYVVPVCGSTIGIPQISQWHARSGTGVFTLRLYSFHPALSRPAAPAARFEFMVPLCSLLTACIAMQTVRRFIGRTHMMCMAYRIRGPQMPSKLWSGIKSAKV
jgi:hypothetical protein